MLCTVLLVMCAGDMHSSLLLSPTLQKWQLGFWFLCILPEFAPVVRAHSYFHSLVVSLYFQLEEMFVQMQALHTAEKGPRFQPVSARERRYSGVSPQTELQF